MNSFFSNRFQRMFSSDFQKRRKRTTSNDKDKTTKSNTEDVAVSAGSSTEEGRDMNLSEVNQLPHEEKQIKKNDIEQ